MTDGNPAYMRMYGWWVLLQSWGTMRFSDHRGLSPADISFADGSLTGLHGQESVCEASESGRKFIHLYTPVALSGMADPVRAGHLQKGLSPSAPAGAYDSCLRTELRYALGYAIQNRLLARLVDDKGATVLTAEAMMFWTPHSGRSFLPSCTQALGFPKEERDFLGGWSHQGSDTYARTAKLRISSMQKSVSKVIAQGPEGDRLGERESMIQLEEHLTKKRKGHNTRMVSNITKKDW